MERRRVYYRNRCCAMATKEIEMRVERPYIYYRIRCWAIAMEGSRDGDRCCAMEM
jgi:hypothetical protein